MLGSLFDEWPAKGVVMQSTAEHMLELPALEHSCIWRCIVNHLYQGSLGLTDCSVFCRNGSSGVELDVRMEPFRHPMMSDPWRMGLIRSFGLVGGIMPCFGSVPGIVLWLTLAIVRYSLFKINVPSSSECVRFGSEFSGWKQVMRLIQKLFGPQCVVDVWGFWSLKVFQIPVIGDHIQWKSEPLMVMSPSFESSNLRVVFVMDLWSEFQGRKVREWNAIVASCHWEW